MATESIITSSSDSATTRYTIVGSVESVQASIDKIMDDYHPYGYGTLIASDQMSGDNRVVVMKRANSCD